MIFTPTFLLILSLFLISFLFISILTNLKRSLEKSRIVNKQLIASRNSALEYIDALWQSQQNIILDEKIASLSSLVAGVAHELNTPLGVALTALSYIDESELCDDMQPMIDLTRSNLNKAINLIEKFTEITGKNISQKSEPLILDEFLKYTLCLILSPITNQHLSELEINIHGDLLINTTEATLSVIIKNILENAFEYAYKQDDCGKVSISSIIQDKDLILIIKDNGCGMSSKEISHIFEPFYTTRRPEQHYGLGLAIAYNLLTRFHNGSLTCNSVPGVGTEMIITLPQIIVEQKITISNSSQN